MRYKIETSVQGETRVVAECDGYLRATALAKLACVEHCSPSMIREDGHPHQGMVVYYGDDVGETVDAARAMAENQQ